MPSPRILEKKQKVVESMREIFQSNGIYFFDYRGLKVPEMEALRNKIKELNAHIKVIKNRLALKYLEKENLEISPEIFKDPTAIAYGGEQFVEVAKILVDFSEENENLRIKSGFLEHKQVDADQIKEVAKLPGREQLLAKLAFCFGSVLKKFGMILSAPLRDTHVLLQCIKDKKEKEEKSNG